MVAEVVAFAMVMSIFEFVILLMVPPRLRLRLLGSDAGKVIVHCSMLILNLWVHWGTVVGTMSSTLSFIVSMAVLGASMRLFGSIKDGRFYTIGWIRYEMEEIR